MENRIQREMTFDVSILVPISDYHDNLKSLFQRFRKELASLNLHNEFIFVIDGDFPAARIDLAELQAANTDVVKVVSFNKPHGEAKALSVAFAESSGEIILTLPAYFQVEPEEIGKMFTEFSFEVDLIVGCRYPRQDNILNRVQAKVFHGLVSRLIGISLRDISCGVRLLRRRVLEKIYLYGDMHRFFPLLAHNRGFRVKELALKQASENIHLRVYGPGVYLRRLLDILTIFFLIKFTQKPLRFFGLLGFGIGFIGLVISLVTVIQRLYFDVSLAGRPLFLGGILFLLVGLQTFFIGLVAEIIIFTHMPEEPQYLIDEIIE